MVDRAMGSSPAVDPEVLAEEIRRGEALAVLDVRNRDEFEAWHVDGPAVDARQVPYNRLLAAKARGDLEEQIVEAFGYRPHDRVTVVCGEGHASDEVAAALRAVGFDAANLTGGMAAWGSVYTLVPLTDYRGPGRVLQYHRPSTGCLAYLIVQGEAAAVVDPLRVQADRYVDDASNVATRLLVAADTHVHADHLSGVRAVAERTGAAAMIPAGAVDRGLAFEATTFTPGPIPAGNEAFAVGDVSVRALAVPGHTPEMSAFLVGNVLLSGDSLLLGSVARPDLAGEARELAGTLYDALERLLQDLPEDTVVAPGHAAPTDAATGGAYVTTIADLRRDLPLLDVDREAFVDRISGQTPPTPANYERLVATNLGREEIGNESAGTLELGPNNCAATVE